MNKEQAINQIYDLKYEWECEGLLTKLNQTDINAMGIIISNLEDLQRRIDKLIEKINFYKTTEWGLKSCGILEMFEEILKGNNND